MNRLLAACAAALTVVDVAPPDVPAERCYWELLPPPPDPVTTEEFLLISLIGERNLSSD